jgi:dTDP-4-dehydrorhamnose 3,5-epimerase
VSDDETARVRLIDLPVFADSRGALAVAESGGAVPFPIRRLFHLFDLAPDAERGHHAHRAQQQCLIMLGGRCTVIADDGRERRAFTLDTPRRALIVAPMIWLELADFSPGAVCAILASGVYDEADYIRDHREFLRLTARSPGMSS